MQRIYKNVEPDYSHWLAIDYIENRCVIRSTFTERNSHYAINNKSIIHNITCEKKIPIEQCIDESKLYIDTFEKYESKNDLSCMKEYIDHIINTRKKTCDFSHLNYIERYYIKNVYYSDISIKTRFNSELLDHLGFNVTITSKYGNYCPTDYYKMSSKKIEENENVKVLDYNPLSRHFMDKMCEVIPDLVLQKLLD